MVIISWITVVSLELTHAPKPDFWEAAVQGSAAPDDVKADLSYVRAIEDVLSQASLSQPSTFLKREAAVQGSAAPVYCTR